MSKKPKAFRKPGSKYPNIKISPKHVKKLLANCDTTREKLIINILLETGMRVSDLVTMLWKNVNFEDMTYQYVSKKTNVSVYIPLSLRTITVLKKYKRIYKTEKVVIPLSTSRIRQILREIRDRAKITRKISPHDLRKTSICVLLANGVPLKAVADIVGCDPRTISLYYAQFDIEELRDYHERAFNTIFENGDE